MVKKNEPVTLIEQSLTLNSSKDRVHNSNGIVSYLKNILTWWLQIFEHNR